MTHVIRLRGPWELEPVARFGGCGELPAGGRTRVPGDWGELLGDDFAGRVRYTRRFNRPTNLEPDERVWLVVAAVDHQARLALNGQPFAELSTGAAAARDDITPLLRLHNVLEIEVTLPAETYHDRTARGDRAGKPGGLVGEVRLEIERA